MWVDARYGEEGCEKGGFGGVRFLEVLYFESPVVCLQCGMFA